MKAGEQRKTPAAGPDLSSDSLRLRLLEAAAELRKLALREPRRARELRAQAARIEALADVDAEERKRRDPPLPRDLSR